MAWLAIKLHAEARTADAIADALIEAGALSVSCDDADAGTADEAAQFGEPGLDPAQPWRRNLLTALVDADASPGNIVAEAARACGIKPPSFECSVVEEEDWVRRSQLQFEPIHIADGLWIVPSWREPPDPAAMNIAIDPGLAFGTGSHPTTRLVLRWLAKALKGGETVLDYGCGSGILAIAALKLGAGEAYGVDIDPQALATSVRNAADNAVGGDAAPLRLFLPDDLPAIQADIVVANILARPLIVLAPLLAARTTGRIALSGILAEQAAEVLECYRAWFDIAVAAEREGWVLLAGRRREASA